MQYKFMAMVFFLIGALSPFVIKLYELIHIYKG